MSSVGKPEIVTQKRLIDIFNDPEGLGYDYLGDWQKRDGNSNVEKEILSNWLASQGHSAGIINKVLTKLDKEKSISGATQLYDANRAVYDLLRYGVKTQSEAGEQKQTIWLIDWENVTAPALLIEIASVSLAEPMFPPSPTMRLAIVTVPLVVSSASFFRKASSTLTVRVSPLIAVVAFVPPAMVSVSPGVMPVEPLSPATVVSETAKSSVPSAS